MTTLPARIAVWIVGFVLALIAIVAVGVFLCVALYAFLCTLMAPALAALASALVVLVMAFVILATAGAIAGALRQQTRKSVRPSANLIGAELGRMLGEDAQSLIAKKPWLTLVFAIAAGFLVGLSPRLRDLALRILRG